MNKHLIVYAILILIILYFVNGMLTKKTSAPAPAVVNGAKAWTVYGTNGCGWTRKQIEVMDAKSIPYVFVDCDSEDCKGASAFPTLVDPAGKKTVGFNNLE